MRWVSILYKNSKNRQLLVGWVEERNPTKVARTSTQPTIWMLAAGFNLAQALGA
jgi:hypothetical protein